MQIYIPLLSVQQLSLNDGYNGAAGIQDNDTMGKIKADEEQQLPESRGPGEVRDELLSGTYKFLGVLDKTLQQLEGMPVTVPNESCTEKYWNVISECNIGF